VSKLKHSIATVVDILIACKYIFKFFEKSSETEYMGQNWPDNKLMVPVRIGLRLNTFFKQSRKVGKKERYVNGAGTKMHFGAGSMRMHVFSTFLVSGSGNNIQ
jgi:hypothetical protein